MTIDEQIALVDSRVDMIDYISQYSDFTKKGREYWALSPLTAERTPSFSVNTDQTDRHVFKDFSSGCSGDIVDFVKAYESVGTKKAIEILSQYASIDGEELARKTHLQPSEVAKMYHRRATKRVEINGHKVLPPDYMNRYQKDNPALDLWRIEGIDDATMKKFDVRFDPFSNRIVFPLRDNAGKSTKREA